MATLSPQDRVREGFRRLAIVVGVLCALPPALVGSVLFEKPGWQLGLAATVGLGILGYALGWVFVRAIGWIVAGFFGHENGD